MIREQLITELRSAAGGLTLPTVLSRLRIDPYSPIAAAVEAILILTPEAQCMDSRWRLIPKGRSARILSEIEAYASSSGKIIFRAASALASLPTGEHPTADELKDVLDASGGRFSLLANDMIRRNG